MNLWPFESSDWDLSKLSSHAKGTSIKSFLFQSVWNFFSENFSDFRKFSDLRKIFRFSENFQIFGKFSDFGKNFRFWEKFQILGKFSDFGKIFRFSKKIQIFRKFSDFGKIFSHVMSPHHSDQMSQWSQVSRIALCMAKVNVS